MVDKLGVGEAITELQARWARAAAYLSERGWPEDHDTIGYPAVVGLLAGYERLHAIPANGEQVERVAAIARDLIPSYEDRAGGYDKTLEILRFAATLSTPTEDARSRVKVLEEALREIVAEADKAGSDAGLNLAAIIAEAALGNKETDRHG